MGTAITLAHPGTETLLASAARTTTQTGDTKYNNEAAGVLLSVLVTAGATLSLTPKIQFSPDGGATWIDYCVITAALTTTGNVSYLVYPGILASADGAVTESFNLPLPRVWRLVVTHGNANSATYSVQAMYL